MEFIKSFLEPVKTDNGVVRFQIDGVNVSNMFYSIALYRSIQEFARTLNEPELSEILDKFSSIYSIKNLGIGVNSYFLERDVTNIRETVDEKKPMIGMKILLGELKHGQLRKSVSAKRNFFAHSGFLQEYTLIDVSEEKICVRWIEDKKREIERWIRDPEKN